MNQTNCKQLYGHSILYMEPNTLITSNGTDGKVQTAPLLEDYCMFFDMDVEFVGRKNDIATSLFRFSYNVEHDEVQMGFVNQGSQYGPNKSDRALTTAYAEVGYKEVTEGLTSAELFGVTSIKIDYKDWQCPTVDMQITDIRGYSIFGVEEYSHKLVRADGENGQADTDNVNVTDSFFHAFFTLPYPRFTMYIKGFYGQPIAYNMAISKFKATFDSKTGNFGANIQFIGFTFGILNDIDMPSLASVVSITNLEGEGKEYWEEQVKWGRFTLDGTLGSTPLLRLSEIVYKYQQYKMALKDVQDELEQSQTTEQSIMDILQGIKTCLTNYINAVNTGAVALVNNIKKTMFADINGGTLTLRTYDSHGEPQETPVTIKEVHSVDCDLTNVFGKEPTTAQTQIVTKDVKETAKRIVAKQENGKITLAIPDGNIKMLQSDQTEGRGNHAHDMRNYTRLYASQVRYNADGTRNQDTLLPLLNNAKCVNNVGLDVLEDKKPIQSYEYYGYTHFNSNTTHFSLSIDSEGWGSTQFINNENEVFNNNVRNRTGSTTSSKLNKTWDKLTNQGAMQDVSLEDLKDKFTQQINDGINQLNNGDKKEIADNLKKIKDAFDKHCDMEVEDLTYIPTRDDMILLPVECAYTIYPEGYKVVEDRSQDKATLTPNDLIELPVTHYVCDLSECLNLLNSIIEPDVDKKYHDLLESKIEALQNQYLNFETSLIYITKSLWAHAETFLHYCVSVNEQIRSSNRTVEDLHLNMNNSNLSSSQKKNSKEFVGAFPTILTTQIVNGNEKRQVYGWIEDVCGVATPESQMITHMLQGTRQYYIWAKSGEEDLVEPDDRDGASEKDIKISYYKYLTNIFNKWIHGMMIKEDRNPGHTWLDDWGVREYFETHFYFIDTFYQSIGNDKIGVNKETLCENAVAVYNGTNASLLEFMSNIFKSCNTILNPTQGFMLNTIENANDGDNFYSRIFDIIPYNEMTFPDPKPYFIVIYRGDPSEYLDIGTNEGNQNDGFMICDTDYDSLVNDVTLNIPEGLSKDENAIHNGEAFTIPAIGVTYGRQYQSVFTDINLDMNTAMPNEVSIQAEYELCGAATNRGNGSGEIATGLGQDLYTVYANNSYTCTVTMMGCMWIQPLMYFQLNNIPMFRGTYMVQRVEHTMTPGNMTTQFTGVRMCRFASPFVNANIMYLGAYGSSGDDYYSQEAAKKAEFDNDCPYKIYDVNVSDPNAGGNHTFTQSWLDTLFGRNFPLSDVSDQKDVREWYEVARNWSTKVALAAVVYCEDSGDDLSRHLEATVLYNHINDGKYHICGSEQVYKTTFLCRRQFESMEVYCTVKGVRKLFEKFDYFRKNYQTDETIQKCIQTVNDVFTKSPSVTMSLTNLTLNQSPQYTIKFDDLRALYYAYASADQKNNYARKLGAHLSQGSLGPTKYFTEHVGGKDIYFWDAVTQSTANTDTTKQYVDNFISAVTRTYNDTEIKKNKFEDAWTVDKTTYISKRCIVFTLKKTDDNIASPLLTDIIFNAYSQYVTNVTCRWDVPHGNAVDKDTYPTVIVIWLTQSPSDKCKNTTIKFRSSIVLNDGSAETLFKIQKDQFPESFLKILKKKSNALNGRLPSTFVGNEFIE